MYITVEYQNVSVRALDAAVLGPNYALNNDTGAVSSSFDKTDARTNMSGVACSMDKYDRMNYWHGFRTVPDPENPDDLVLMVTATNAPALHYNNTTAAIWAGYGFGDTVYPAFTFEIRLGAVNGKMPTTGKYYFRNRVQAEGISSYGVDLPIYTIEGGEVRLADGTPVGQIPETGMARFAITIDALTNKIYGYCENAEGEIERTAESDLQLSEGFLTLQQRHADNLADEDPSNDNTFIAFESIFNFFTKSTLEPTWVVGSGAGVNKAFEESEIEIDGVMTKIKNEDGSFNKAAVQALAERDYSFLLDDFKISLGYVYE